MNETDLVEHFGAASGEMQPRPAPFAEIRERARRRRSTRLTLLAVAAIVVAAGAATVPSLLAERSRPSLTDASGQEDPPAEGLLALAGTSIELPSGWEIGGANCFPLAAGAVFAHPAGPCAGRESAPSYILMTDLDTPEGRDTNVANNGCIHLDSIVRCREDLVLIDVGIGVQVVTPSADTTRMIADSISTVPVEGIAVPPVDQDATTSEVVARLTDAGLQPSRASSDPGRLVTSLEPAAGSVLPAGSPVTLNYGTGPTGAATELVGNWNATLLGLVSGSTTVREPEPAYAQLEFASSGTFTVEAECGVAHGTWTQSGKEIRISGISGQLDACDDRLSRGLELARYLSSYDGGVRLHSDNNEILLALTQ